MLPLFDPDPDRAVERATAALERFPDLFEQHWLNGMRSKLGLFTQEPEGRALVDEDLMHHTLQQTTAVPLTDTMSIPLFCPSTS